MDRTLILVKPDAFERGLTGEIIARFERKGLGIVAMKHMTVERDLAKEPYAEPRERLGAPTPLEAAPGSIRGDFGLEVQTNLVHGSDSPESAARETGLFFPELGGSRPHPRL